MDQKVSGPPRRYSPPLKFLKSSNPRKYTISKFFSSSSFRGFISRGARKLYFLTKNKNTENMHCKHGDISLQTGYVVDANEQNIKCSWQYQNF